MSLADKLAALTPRDDRERALIEASLKLDYLANVALHPLLWNEDMALLVLAKIDAQEALCRLDAALTEPPEEEE